MLREINDRLYSIDHEQKFLRRTLLALTAAQQTAITELATGINTLSDSLDGVLTGAQTTRDALAAMAAEEGREESERVRLEALVASMDADVVGALTPITAQVTAMNDGLQSPATPASPLTANP